MPARPAVSPNASRVLIGGRIPGIRGRRPLLPTPANDRVIAEAYKRFRERGDRTAIKAAAEALGCPRWQINRRASALGLARSKEKAWLPDELAILEANAQYNYGTIYRKLRQAGYTRSINAIHLKVNRLKLKTNLDGYSATKLAAAFGIDIHAVLRWLKLGWVKGSRRGTDRTEQQGGDTWWITHTAVRQFVMVHPDEVDLCKVEKFWFLDLITNGRICR